MGKIKNMGTATMRFKEGIVVTGSVHNPDGTDSSYSLVVSGTIGVQNLIERIGDPDTAIIFEDDKIFLDATDVIVGTDTTAGSHPLTVSGSMNVLGDPTATASATPHDGTETLDRTKWYYLTGIDDDSIESTSAANTAYQPRNLKNTITVVSSSYTGNETSFNTSNTSISFKGVGGGSRTRLFSYKETFSGDVTVVFYLVAGASGTGAARVEDPQGASDLAANVNGWGSPSSSEATNFPVKLVYATDGFDINATWNTVESIYAYKNQHPYGDGNANDPDANQDNFDTDGFYAYRFTITGVSGQYYVGLKQDVGTLDADSRQHAWAMTGFAITSDSDAKNGYINFTTGSTTVEGVDGYGFRIDQSSGDMQFRDSTGDADWVDFKSFAVGGSDGQVQYNNGGVLGGASNLTYDDSLNYLGVGLSNPSNRLHVSGSSNTILKGISVGDKNDSGTKTAGLKIGSGFQEAVEGVFNVYSSDTISKYMQLGTKTSHAIRIITNDAEVARIKSGGDVGIGTTSPDSKLHVNESGTTQVIAGDNNSANQLSQFIAKASEQSNNVQTFLSSVDTSGGGSVGSVGTIGAHDFQIKTNSVIRAVVDAGGNTRVENDAYVLGDLHVTGTFRPSSIGVNTNFAVAAGSVRIEKRDNAPSFILLHSASSFSFDNLPDNAQSSFGAIQFRGSDNTTSGDVAAAEISATTDRGGLDASNGLMPTSIVFATGDEDSNGTKERMRITSQGRLGIGRKNPAFTLQIERSGSSGAPSFGLVRRGVDVSANTEMHRINFSLVGNDDDGIIYFTPAQIVARNIQDIRVNPNENEVESPQHGIGTELIFRTTVSGSTTTQNAAILTSNKEWECDTLRGINTETNEQRIAFNFDNVDVPIGPNINVKNRIDFFAKGDEGSAIRHAAFIGNFNAYTEQVSPDTTLSVPRQPNRAYFNPDNNGDFQFRFDSANGGALLTMTSSATTTGQDGQINMGSSTNAGNGYVNIWKPVASSLSADLVFNNVSDSSADRDMFISFYNQTIENARIITKRNSGDSFDADFTIRTRAHDGNSGTSNFSDRFMITKSGSILLHENDLTNTNASVDDTSLFVSGTIGLSGNAARNSVFGGDVIASGSLDIKQQASFEDYMIISVTADNTDIQVGAAQAVFRAPFAMELYQPPRASLTTAATTLTTVDIHVDGNTIMDETASGSRLRIDGNESTSTTASTACVLTNTSINDDAQIRIDVDTAGTGGRGLKVTLYYRRAL